jgi:hypothetical protein
MDNLKEMLLKAPDGQLDHCTFPLIQTWPDKGMPPAIKILELLDQCVHGGLASGFTINLLEIVLNTAIMEENTTYEEVVKQATWRD